MFKERARKRLHGFGGLVNAAYLKSIGKLDVLDDLPFVRFWHWWLSIAKTKCSYFHKI